MISRCKLGLPIRIREDEGTIDFTDSAFLSGMLSLFGSKEEKLDLYISKTELVRHPEGDQNDTRVTLPENTSRDQLVAWSSTKSNNPEVNKTRLHYAKKWFINKDFLGPQIKLYLYIQANEKAPAWLYPLAYLFLFLDLIFSHLISPRNKEVKDQHEINQALCLYNAFGLIKLFLLVHPTPDENMKDYYCGWRNQKEIYEMYLKWKEKL